MIATKLYWVEGPWPGKLAVAARPRGGDWLAEEMAAWRSSGVNTVFSLLTPEEEAELDLTNEASTVAANGMRFLSFPIPDREVPHSQSELTEALRRLDQELSSGRNVALHCRQGIGRSGLVVACLLLTKGLDAETVVEHVSSARGTPIPETAEQRRWIDH